MKKLLLLLAILVIIVSVAQKKQIIPQVDLEKYLGLRPGPSLTTQKQTIVDEESAVISVIEKSLQSVVTIGVSTTISSPDILEFNPFDPFEPFNRLPQNYKKIEGNIGSGFIVGENGILITNKHVVSDTAAKYKILLNDKRKFDVVKIYRDPLNDLAILKINTNGLNPLKLGDSSQLKLGQLAIAIGTPLGEFTNTVTKGIISGLGRGITTGSPFEGYVEKLDNVIQTDAAVNPGNSGGPLLNSSGEVIGVNTAIAQGGENIGFAIPVNVVKNLIDNFKKNGGSFDRPYVGIKYKMIDKQTAVLNELVEGAYVVEVIEDSPAWKANIQDEDIIIEFNGSKVKGDDEQGFTKMLMEKKVGDKITLKIVRNKQTLEKQLILEVFRQ